MKWSRVKRLLHDIIMLISTRDVHQCDEAFLDLITNGVAIYLHVLRSFMEDRIGGDMHCRLIDIEELRIRRNLDVKTREKLLQPE